MASYTLRPGTLNDMPRLSEIERNAAQKYSKVPGYEFCATGAIRDHSEFQRGLDNGIIIVAEPLDTELTNDAKLAGFALMWRVDGEVHLAELDVAREYQGQGIGKALVSACEDWARRASYTAITLTTYSEIPWNLPFYLRLGYSIFEPETSRTGLAAIVEDERLHGFRAKPRVAMRKRLEQ